MSAPARVGSLRGSLQRVVDTLLEIVQLRLQLLGTEIELQKLRLFDALLWSALALLLLGVGLVLGSAWLLLLLREEHRLLALGLLALLFVGGGIGLLSAARRRLHDERGAFATSADEISRDRALLGDAQER